MLYTGTIFRWRFDPERDETAKQLIQRPRHTAPLCSVRCPWLSR